MKQEFEIKLRKKIPIITNLCSKIFGIFCVLSLLAYWLISPSDNTPIEIRLTFFNLWLSEILQYIIGISFAGTVLFGILFLRSRRYRNAILIFTADGIQIEGTGITTLLYWNQIIEIIFSDDTKRFKNLGGLFSINIHLRGDKRINARLVHYIQADEFVNAFLPPHPSIKYDFLNFEFNFEMDKEEL